MIHKLLSTTLLTCSLLGASFSTHAAFLFENENKELEHSVAFKRAHFMKKGEFERICESQFQVKATFIPQTLWDLFIYMNVLQQQHVVPGREFTKITDHLRIFDLSCQMRGFISTNNLNQAMHGKQFDVVVKIMLDSIQRHLQAYVSGGKELGDATNIWLHLNHPSLRVIGDLLARSCHLEQRAYDNDQLPLWRHSRTNVKLTVNGQDTQVCDVPFYTLTKISVSWSDLNKGTETQTFGLGALSYAYSLIGNIIYDGTINSLGDNRGNSACTLSYLMAEVRDRAHVKGTLPFTPVGSHWDMNTKDKLSANLPTLSFVSILLMPKAFVVNSHEWYLPEIPPSSWISQDGERSHPRHRGTIPGQPQNADVYQCRQSYTTEHALLNLAANFIDQSSTMEILIVNGEIVTKDHQPTIEKIIHDRRAVANILRSGNPQTLKLLTDSLPKTSVIVPIHNDVH